MVVFGFLTALVLVAIGIPVVLSFGGGIGLLVWLVGLGLAVHLGNAREAPVQGFLAGYLFGPLGALLMLGVDNRPACPFCAERHLSQAVLCPHCQKSFAPPKAQADPQPDDWQNQHVELSADRAAWAAAASGGKSGGIRRSGPRPGDRTAAKPPAAAAEDFDRLVAEDLARAPAAKRPLR